MNLYIRQLQYSVIPKEPDFADYQFSPFPKSPMIRNGILYKNMYFFALQTRIFNIFLLNSQSLWYRSEICSAYVFMLIQLYSSKVLNYLKNGMKTV